MHAFSYRLATALVALLMLVVLYVTVYLALVRRSSSIGSHTHVVHGSEYRWLGSHGHTLFWPVHRLDRRLRFGYWTESISPDGSGPEWNATVMEMAPLERKMEE